MDFDAELITDYSGRRGTYYWTTETYRDSNDNLQTRNVRKTTWSTISGSVRNSFHNMLVLGTTSLPTSTINKLEPWDLKNLVTFDERYLSGFRAENFQISPENARSTTESKMNPQINRTIRDDIGGDEREIFNSHSEYLESQIKYILLPVWVGSFQYNKRVYQYVINASTGEVIGKYPRSPVKIGLACLMVIALIIGIIIYYNPALFHSIYLSVSTKWNWLFK